MLYLDMIKEQNNNKKREVTMKKETARQYVTRIFAEGRRKAIFNTECRYETEQQLGKAINNSISKARAKAKIEIASRETEADFVKRTGRF